MMATGSEADAAFNLSVNDELLIGGVESEARLKVGAVEESVLSINVNVKLKREEEEEVFG